MQEWNEFFVISPEHTLKKFLNRTVKNPRDNVCSGEKLSKRFSFGSLSRAGCEIFQTGWFFRNSNVFLSDFANSFLNKIPKTVEHLLKTFKIKYHFVIALVTLNLRSLGSCYTKFVTCFTYFFSRKQVEVRCQ